MKVSLLTESYKQIGYLWLTFAGIFFVLAVTEKDCSNECGFGVYIFIGIFLTLFGLVFANWDRLNYKVTIDRMEG